MRIRLSQGEIALHSRRIVVDAERQVGGVGDVEEEPLDVGFRRAVYRPARQGWRRRRRCLWRSAHWRWSIWCCCRCSRRRSAFWSDFILAVSTMIFFFSSGESMEVSPVEPMISTALVPCPSWKRSRDWNAAKSTEPSLLNGVISATNEPVIFCLGMRFSGALYSLPPCGEGGGGGWGGVALTFNVSRPAYRFPPLPLPTRGRGKEITGWRGR